MYSTSDYSRHARFHRNCGYNQPRQRFAEILFQQIPTNPAPSTLWDILILYTQIRIAQDVFFPTIAKANTQANLIGSLSIFSGNLVGKRYIVMS